MSDLEQENNDGEIQSWEDKYLQGMDFDAYERLKNWPRIPYEASEKPNNDDELLEIILESLKGIDAIVHFMDCDDEEVGDSIGIVDSIDGKSSINFLLMLLENAKSVEQVRDLVRGCCIEIVDDTWNTKRKNELANRFPEKIAEKLRREVLTATARREVMYKEEEIRNGHYYAERHIVAATGHFSSHRESDVFENFTKSLGVAQYRKYYHEPNNDCLSIMLTDTKLVFPKHMGVKNTVEREIPEEKRMTHEKIARFMEFPQLDWYIAQDEMAATETICSNLTIIAEYMCENDKSLQMDEINSEHIDEWMSNKFEKYKPSMDVAVYIWARFLGTEFEKISIWVEQYIIDRIEEEDAWIFDYTGKKREDCSGSNDLLVLLKEAVDIAKERNDKEKSNRLLRIIPAHELLEASMGSKYYKDSKEAKFLHKMLLDDIFLYLPSKYNQERYDNDFNGLCLDLFQEKIGPDEKWNASEGFEILDPMAISGYSNERGWKPLIELTEKAEKQIEKMTPKEILKFKNEVVDRLPEDFQYTIKRIIQKVAESWTVKYTLRNVPFDKLVDLSLGIETEEKPVLLLEEGILLEDIIGAEKTGKRLEGIAERTLLGRFLGEGSGVRGGEKIINYLMDHRDTMIPADIVSPSEDAPNREIIREFKSSEDLLGLLTIATLLGYLGYSYEEIMVEINMLVAIAEQEKHEDITTIGAEHELVGATPEGMIVNEDRFPWLLNVIAMGGDRDYNEIKTPPTLSTVIQKYIFKLVTDPRFKFINPEVLWDAVARSDRSPSSIHLNLAVPKEIPFSTSLVEKYTAPIQEIQWLANGGNKSQNRVGRGRVSGWKGGALLDVLEVASEEQKIEVRNLGLDENGDYEKQIENLQLLMSSAIQFMKEKAGLKQSNNGLVMAQIYADFMKESKIVLNFPEDKYSQIAARALMKKFADAVKSEINRPKTKKEKGIILL